MPVSDHLEPDASQSGPTIRDFYQPGRLSLSIEIFPPKSEASDEALLTTLRKLSRYQPVFISCTYGAGGSTQNRTLDWCRKIQHDLKLPATAHFTCVGATSDQLLMWLDNAVAQGVRNIMALRGDPPQGESDFQPVAGGLQYANELVSLIREHYPDLGVGVAGYPEKHPECSSILLDMKNLKRKVNAGADAVFTQLFYENKNFLRFRDRCALAGIEKPIVPGIMPITDFARIQRITSMCGAFFPEDLSSRLEAVKHDKQAQFQIGVDYAIAQCEELIKEGIPGIHFYVLNRSQACEQILDALGIETGS